MMNRWIVALCLSVAPLYAVSAQACPCNGSKPACACPGGAASCPNTCAHPEGAAADAKKDDAKKNDKGAQAAPKK